MQLQYADNTRVIAPGHGSQDASAPGSDPSYGLSGSAEKWLSFTNYGKYYILSTTQLVSLYKRTIAGSALRKISVAQHAWIAKYSEEDIDSGFEEYGRR